MLMDSKSSNTSVLTDHSPVNESKHVYSSNKISSGATISPDKRIVQRKDSLKLDDVRSNGWLDAMKCSSPPRKKTCKDSKFEVSSGDSVGEYFSWMVNYPSALNSFERIMDRARNKKIVMFLDYDGTLSPIVDDPDSAFMSDEMRTTVMNIANYIPTAIISGRSRDKVYKLVGLTELYYAGSHGMDIMFPVNDIASANLLEAKRSTNPQEKEANIYQPAINFIPMIDEVFRTLVEHTSDIQGAKVENHKFCASVHYRNVDEKNWPIIGQRVHDILKDYPRLRTTHGRKVLEVRPVIDWNKGKAVEFFLDSLGLNNRDDVLPIYIGDDKTDEDAFKVLRDGNRGFGILVTSFPKETNALFSLRDPLEVQEFLSRLCDGNRKCGLAQSGGEPTAADRSSA